MKTTMTERDKKLLVGMLLFVIVVAIGYWGILPQAKKYIKLESKIEKEEDEKKINQLKLVNTGTVSIQADDYENKIAERKDEFYQVMKSSEIDRMMTELASDRGLDIYDLSFTMPGNPTARTAYQYSTLYTTQQQMMEAYEGAASEESEEAESDPTSLLPGKKKTKTEMEIMNEVMGGEVGGYQPNTDIYAVPVTMTVGGEVEDLHAFLNDIIGIDKRILLVGYSWGEFRDVIRRDAEGNIISKSSESALKTEAASETTEDGVTAEELSDTALEVVIRKSLTVRLEIYMCDTSDVNSSEDAVQSEDGAAAESTDGTSSDEVVDVQVEEQ